MKALQFGVFVCLFLVLVSVIGLASGGSTNFIGGVLFFGAAAIGLIYALYTRERDQHRARQSDAEAQPKA